MILRFKPQTFLLLILILLLTATQAFASGSGMPWEAPLSRIADSITGPVARVFGLIAIVSTGFALAFGEGGGVFRRLLQIVFGLSIAFTASSFLLGFFGFGGGAAF